MESEDYSLMTNDELDNRLSELEAEYNESKFIVTEYMRKLIDLKNEYDVIADVRKQRGGTIETKK